ncbi:hypothetical protein [Butyrivibrio sp. AE2032]|uniref:hypothetical protein n=1 Tax=Butyrivibrio sp. AE2032 TaxID=1458463 RepID=UPI00163AAFA8|nr:hypothetical protein [Butyrivibrio sp. AE2032]
MVHNSYDYLNIFGPNNSGKTAYLNALRAYNSEKFDTDTCNNYDRHFVIYLDFSDFAAIAYIDAVNYFRKKMSELYQSLYEDVQEGLSYYTTLEFYLNVIEGISDERELARSLGDIAHFVRCGRQSQYCFRPLILIDEVSRPLIYAAKYGFLDEMKEFYDAFLDIDHYEMASGIITTSFAPANTDVHFDLKYIQDVPVNQYEPMKSICKSNGIELVEPKREKGSLYNNRYFDDIVSLEQCLDKLIAEESFIESPLSRYEIELSPEIKSFVSSKRIQVIVDKYEHEKAEKKRLEREIIEFEQPLATGIVIPSRFAGIRELEFDIIKRGEYDRINAVLMELYDKYGAEVYAQNVYFDIQHIGYCYENESEIRSVVGMLKDYADSKGCSYRCCIDVRDHDWAKIKYERFENDPGYGDMALIKVYISVIKSSEIIHVFDDVVRFLIDNGTHRFCAKTAIRERTDHICFWLGREDFFLLEKYVAKYDEILEKTLDFVPYRGKIGITREFYSWLSYNSFLSELIEVYLKDVEGRMGIDVLEMYSSYVKAWNGELEADSAFSKKFRESNAQELLVLLESLDVILGKATIEDDSILLSGDGELWRALGNSKNWYEVGVNIKRRIY